MRICVAGRADLTDGRAARAQHTLTLTGHRVERVCVVDVYIIANLPALVQHAAGEFLADPVAQRVIDDDDVRYRDHWSLLVEIAYRPGVTDPVATTIRDALATKLGPLPEDVVVQTGRQLLLDADLPARRSQRDASAREIARVFHNPLVEQATVIVRSDWDRGSRPPAAYPVVHGVRTPAVERFAIAEFDDEGLRRFSRERLLALDLREMRAIRNHYASVPVMTRRSEVGLGPRATDVELEMIAQTWSEHCKHKIFSARITYTDETKTGSDRAPEVVDGLFSTYIRGTTERVAPDDSFVKSVFDDNAGVISFDEETVLCFKAETHNSPSALDPYGGAITGIVGVNRDILGTGMGARPIFNTDVLCFGPPGTRFEDLPEGLLHPRRVLAGVHRGIIDGGNQSGIPVAAGAFLFDESYIGKPLVFCGTGGLLPSMINGEASWVKHIDPGDFAVMVGGRIGKDGIHGATFSSLGLGETSPASAVQIGDPITQRRMTDFLLEARDAGLYRGITDNGAGGLSSSLGEMARESGGVDIDLDACPLKYGGLAAWEILVSESQERMSLAVSPATADDLLSLARRRGVEATIVGRFTDDGWIRIRHRGDVVGEIDLDFLHDGLPRMELTATWPGPRTVRRTESAGERSESVTSESVRSALLSLLADPNITSKEHFVRQYDHEVQGTSVVKPLCGAAADGPSDGALLKPRYDSWRGVTVTHGINPWYGDVDPYHMAVAAVDEAVRAHVALGGDPDRMAALDNFCWPDPVLSAETPDGPYKLAQLVRACRGLAHACSEYRLPLISGKDSMKNDSYLGGRKVSIRPTLLVSVMGIMPDIRRTVNSGFRNPGDRILLIGTGAPALGGSAYERLTHGALGGCPVTDAHANAPFYRAIHAAAREGLFSSIHDLSDGGLGVALAESAIAGRLGASVAVPGEDGAGAILTLFGERTGSFIATCAPAAVARIGDVLGVAVHPAAGEDDPRPVLTDIGEVTREADLAVTVGNLAVRWELAELLCAWKSLERMHGDGSGPGAREESSPRDGEIDVPAVDTPPPPGRAAMASTGRPRVIVLTGYGINADRELAEAFRRAGADPQRVHINDLLDDPGSLGAAAVLAIPGGFSYGDHVGSGLMLAHRLRGLKDHLDGFRHSGRLILGICNGFQVLTKMGILPDMAGNWEREVGLVHNESGMFVDRWVTLRVDDPGVSPWLHRITEMDAPVRHGEGRFVGASDATLERLARERRVAFRYRGDNPNGSARDIAGIVDRTGLVLGMMPHPEAFLAPQSHPAWPSPRANAAAAVASQLFRNAVSYAQAI